MHHCHGQPMSFTKFLNFYISISIIHLKNLNTHNTFKILDFISHFQQITNCRSSNDIYKPIVQHPIHSPSADGIYIRTQFPTNKNCRMQREKNRGGFYFFSRCLEHKRCPIRVRIKCILQSEASICVLYCFFFLNKNVGKNVQGNTNERQFYVCASSSCHCCQEYFSPGNVRHMSEGSGVRHFYCCYKLFCILSMN